MSLRDDVPDHARRRLDKLTQVGLLTRVSNADHSEFAPEIAFRRFAASRGPVLAGRRRSTVTSRRLPTLPITVRTDACVLAHAQTLALDPESLLQGHSVSGFVTRS